MASLLSRQISLQCAVVCVKVAQEAIETVHKRRAARVEEIGHLSAWWYNVLFLYTSATVLIAARLSRSIMAEISEASIFESSRKAIEVLEAYSVFGTSIRRLITTLRLLFDTIPQQYSRQRQRNPPMEVDTSAPLERAYPSEAGNSINWYPGGSAGRQFFSALPHESARDPTQDESNPPASEVFWDLDAAFDPNDVSWLTNVPFDT